MTLVELLLLLIIAGICGAIGQSLSGFSRGGCLGAIAIGFIGSLIGTWIARSLDLPSLFAFEIGGTAFPIIWSIIGGAIFVALLGLITRRGDR